MCVIAASSAFGYVQYRSAQIRRLVLPGLQGAGALGDVPGAGAGANAPDESDAPMTILLVGSNTRTGLAPQEAALFGSPSEVGGARSDVTMLLRLDPRRGPSILSIPRDLFVPMPPRAMVGRVGKIDAALNDGPEMLIEAITNDLGIPIDHYVEINFDGFQRAIDALGGIDMSFPAPLRDDYSGLRVDTPGCEHLNGFSALAVVRSRHLFYQTPGGAWQADPESDLSRIRRDHEFLAVFAQAMQERGLTDPLRANAVLGDLVHQVTIDSTLSVPTMVRLLRRYHAADPRAVAQTTLPVTLVNHYWFEGEDLGDVVFPAQPDDTQVIRAFLEGTPLPTAPSSPTAPASPSPPAGAGAGEPLADPRPVAPPVAVDGPGPSAVDVVDISGLGAGDAVAAALSDWGLPLSAVRAASTPASPSETVVRYHPGESSAANHVLALLRGAALIAADAHLPTGKVEVDVGSVVAVMPPPQQTGSAASSTTTPSSTATSSPPTIPESTTSTSTTTTSTTTTSTIAPESAGATNGWNSSPNGSSTTVDTQAPTVAPPSASSDRASGTLSTTPNGEPVTAAVTPLAGFDPTACPKGVRGS